MNAGALAFQARGTYVEGFALDPNAARIHHAWVTLDGIHAIEVTWRISAEVILPHSVLAFSNSVLEACMRRIKSWCDLCSGQMNKSSVSRYSRYRGSASQILPKSADDRRYGATEFGDVRGPF